MPEWLKRETAPINGTLSLEKILSEFFSVRGFSSADDIQKFLNFNLKDLTDPSAMKDMDRAVQRLVEARKKQEVVCGYGDFDMDGTPALALLVRGLRGLGFKNVFYVQPDRHKDGYGFHHAIAQKFIDDHKVSLFVTVDVGITDVDAIEKTQNAGADVIVTDHHQVQDRKPNAYAVVNPNQPECTAGLGHLCGTGVAFYLILALRRALKEQNLLEKDFDAKVLLDCFAIGTVADIVPLIKENRILVKHGLKVLEKTPLVGLRLLLNALKLGEKRLSSQDVGMRFVPKLNSLSRMDTQLKPLDLFLVDDPAKAALMVQDLLKNNDRRVMLLAESEKMLDAMVEQALAEDPNLNCLFFWSEEFHKGLVGLLATQIANKYHRPAFVGALTSHGVITGSARIPEASSANVFEALKSAEAELNKFGGHPQAAGFEVSPENTDALNIALQDYFSQSASEGSTAATFYDLETDFNGVREFMRWSDSLEPFGCAFESPVFRLDRLQLHQVSSMKGGHLKIQFRDISQQIIECVWFFPDKPDFFEGQEGARYSVLCEPQWNEFMGSRRLQLLLKDIAVAAV